MTPVCETAQLGSSAGIRGRRAWGARCSQAPSPRFRALSAGRRVTPFPCDPLRSFGLQQRLGEEPEGGGRARPGWFSLLFASEDLLGGCTLGRMLASPSGGAVDGGQLRHRAGSAQLWPPLVLLRSPHCPGILEPTSPRLPRPLRLPCGLSSPFWSILGCLVTPILQAITKMMPKFSSGVHRLRKSSSASG